jgi:hypothetical protein
MQLLGENSIIDRAFGGEFKHVLQLLGKHNGGDEKMQQNPITLL